MRFTLRSDFVFLLLISLGASHPSISWGLDDPSFTVDCKIDDMLIQVHLTSKSKDPTRDDMIVGLKKGEKEIETGLKSNWYLRAAAYSRIKNICDLTPGFQVPHNRVLVFLVYSDRPSWNRVSALLVDVEKFEVLDRIENLGQLKEGFQSGAVRPALILRSIKNGFELRMVRESLGISDGPEDYIEEWRSITIGSGKLSSEWSRRSGR